MGRHADHVEREQAVAKIVAAWFRANAGMLEEWQTEQDGQGGYIVSARLRIPVTAEEFEPYRLLAGPM